LFGRVRPCAGGGEEPRSAVHGGLQVSGGEPVGEAEREERCVVSGDSDTGAFDGEVPCELSETWEGSE